MLSPKTIGAIAFVALAGALAYWQLGKHDPALERTAPAAALPEFATGDITSLSVTSPGSTTPVTAVRADGAWRLTSPLDDAADADHVRRTLESLGKARLSDRPVAESAQSWTKLGLGNSEVLTVVLRAGDRDVVTVHVSADGRYARVGAEPAAYQVFDLNRALLARELRQWRDRAILSFDPKQVKTVAATANGATVRAERIPAPPPEAGKPAVAKDQWTLVDGASIVAGALDEAQPGSIAQRMATLKADDIADATTSASTAGLATPRLALEVIMTDGATHTLFVGTPVDDHTYVGIAGSDRIWRMRTTTLDYFARTPVQWRDKSIADLAAADVIRIELAGDDGRIVAARGADGAWQLLSPKGAPFAPDQLDALAGAMANFRGAAIAEGMTRRTAGLTKPTTTATFKTKTARVSLSIGKQTDAGTWYAGTSTRKDIVMLAHYTAAKFQKSAADLAAAPQPPSPPRR